MTKQGVQLPTLDAQHFRQYSNINMNFNIGEFHATLFVPDDRHPSCIPNMWQILFFK